MTIKNDRFQVHDIDPIIIVRKLVAKSPQIVETEQSINLSIIDFYQALTDIKVLDKKLMNIDLEEFDTLTEEISSAISAFTGIKIAGPKTSVIPAIEYYNDFLLQKLEFLKKGKGYMSVGEDDVGEPVINDYKEIKTTGLKIFEVKFEYPKLIAGLKKFITEYKGLQDKLHQLFETTIKHNAPSIDKQGELFVEHVKKIQNHLGINKVNIGIRDWSMRMACYPLDNGDRFLHPFNMDYRGKAILPLYLEANGIIDIHDISLVNDLQNHSEADLQYTVSRPCIINIFKSDNSPIPSEMRRILTETQVLIIEKVFENLNEALIFPSKPTLKKSFCDLFIWLVRKLTYCLEEESFLRDKSFEFIQKNKNIKYLKMEDDFFLPFMMEKLSDTFGPTRIQKKPEKFKGEIDLLFDNFIPVELKVWRDKHSDLEGTIDEKFPHIGQAATYASIDRVGFLVILDVSSPNSGLKNIENCWRVLTKEFDIDKKHPTKIICIIFDCNHIQPSKL